MSSARHRGAVGRIASGLLAFSLDAVAVLAAIAVAIVAVTVGNPLSPLRPSLAGSAVAGILPVAILTAAAFGLSYLRPRAWPLVALACAAVLMLDTSLTADRSLPLAAALALAAVFSVLPALAAYRAFDLRRRRREPRLAAIHDKLDAIEAELRRIGYWQHGAQLHPGAETKTFEQWLQLVFLPNARQALAQRQLPADSSVGLMAVRQYDYHTYVAEAQRLVDLLHELDILVRSAASRKSP